MPQLPDRAVRGGEGVTDFVESQPERRPKAVGELAVLVVVPHPGEEPAGYSVVVLHHGRRKTPCRRRKRPGGRLLRGQALARLAKRLPQRDVGRGQLVSGRRGGGVAGLKKRRGGVVISVLGRDKVLGGIRRHGRLEPGLVETGYSPVRQAHYPDVFGCGSRCKATESAGRDAKILGQVAGPMCCELIHLMSQGLLDEPPLKCGLPV